MREQFKDLNLNSWFLFAAVLEDPEACKLVLEIILGREITHVDVRTEHCLLYNFDAKCVRLDVHATDDCRNNYNLEAQNSNDEHNLPRRSRYYQAELDVSSLKPGEDFDELPDCYVIFICTFDPFGDNLYRYTFRKTCDENGRNLDDGAVTIFLSTEGKNADEVPLELIHFLNYFKNSTDRYVATIEDGSIKKLHGMVTDVKQSRRLETEFMTLEQYVNGMKGKWVREAKAEGESFGEVKALINSIRMFLSEYGILPDEVCAKLEAESDIDKLSTWLKLAAKVDSIEAFIAQM